MKILHILATPRAEGTPNLVLDWLATGRHEQEVFVLHREPADLTARLREAASWYAEEDFFSRGPRKFPGIAAAVRRVCRERRPDLLVCWIAGFGNWVCLGARLAGVRRLLVHCGNPPSRGWRGDWMSRYGLWPLALLGARCVCCSDYVKGQFQAVPGIPDGLFATVWNCARAAEVAARAAAARATRTATPPTALMVATLEAHKDHDTLLRAVPAIRHAMPDFRLLLAGDGSRRAQLEALSTSLGIADSVAFLGMRRDVPELLGRADLFVFSTTPQEGLGSVLLEAMAAGLPIVASDVPACRETLAGGAHGTLVPPHDPGALAGAILKTLGEPRREESLAASRDLALSFTADRMMDRYLELSGLPGDA